MGYLYNSPGVNTHRGQLLSRKDVEIDDLYILADIEPDATGDDNLDDRNVNPLTDDEPDEIDASLMETMAYRRKIATAKPHKHDRTEFKDDIPEEDSLIQSDSDQFEPPNILSDDPEDYEDYVPSSVLNYYNETALTSKQRNALPTAKFGIPRLRAYPLNDRKHVLQAIRMFHHCKDPQDRKTLAGNIKKAMDEYKIKDTQVGPKNPLRDYIGEQKPLKESVEDTDPPGFILTGLGTPMNKRTKEDVIREHLYQNSMFYNNIFYGDEYIQAVKSMNSYVFLEYFYPNLIRMPFHVRLHCVCGGLANPENASGIYQELHMRLPLETNFSTPIGWGTEQDFEYLDGMVVDTIYNSDDNWFKVDLSDDLTHLRYCLRLYSILGKILLDPNFNPDTDLTPEHQAVLSDWIQHVQYHYDLYRDASPDSVEEARERQYLWDLLWNFNDNPEDRTAITGCIIYLLKNMACVQDQVINMNEANDSGEIVSKEECSAYLVQDLGMPDSIYLLPGLMRYPIIDKISVKLAMDMVNRVEKEYLEEYTQNLNRKYRELGCNFSISVDHPYAKYADKTIVNNMIHFLMEDGSAVADEKSSESSQKSEADPWYKRVEFDPGRYMKNLSHPTDTNPARKKIEELDTTRDKEDILP